MTRSAFSLLNYLFSMKIILEFLYDKESRPVTGSKILCHFSNRFARTFPSSLNPITVAMTVYKLIIPVKQ